MFTITQHKGFNLRFENGWAISVQFGPFNYCTLVNKTTDINAPANNGMWKAETAEIAILDPSGEFYQPPEWEDQVKGHCDPAEVVKWIVYTQMQDAAHG